MSRAAMQYDIEHQQDGSALYDCRLVVARLEEAGSVIMALPNTGPTTRMRTVRHDIVHDAIEAYGGAPINQRLRPPVPNSAQITRMDEAMGWIAAIPRDKYVIRRIVGARALISPLTERHIYPWRRLAALLGADHKAIQRWHAQGIEIIVASLNRPALSKRL